MLIWLQKMGLPIMPVKAITVIKSLFMREPIRDRERLLHIIDAADFVMAHSKNLTYDSFISDKLLYGSLIYYTMVIGEAGYKLSREFIEKFNDTPWADIAGMRHHIVHGYYKVDNHVVWNVITKDIPALRMRVQQYLDEIDWAQWEAQPKSF